MATIALMVGGAITNALAFSGSNFLFSQMSGAEERKRHNLAMENYNMSVILGTKGDFKELTTSMKS